MFETFKRLLILPALLAMIGAASISCKQECPAPAAPESVMVETSQGSTISAMLDQIDKDLGDLSDKMGGGRGKAALDESKVNDFDLTGAPTKGAENPKLTMVVFSDLECPYCKRFAASAHALVDKYKDDMKLVFMNFPLNDACNDALNRPFHKSACIAAEAAMEAAHQGKFWEMHDKIFEGGHITEDKLVNYATELGLDAKEVKDAIDNQKYNDLLRSQAKQLMAAGGRGTPTVFINGMMVKNANWQDIPSIEKFLDGLINPESAEEDKGPSYQMVDNAASLPKAQVVLEDGTLLEDRLAAIEDKLAELNPEQAARRQRPKGPDPAKKYDIEIGDSPVLGPKDAPVTIVEFSDFTCPHCENMAGVLKEVQKQFPDKVKIVFKNTPNQGHKYSVEAHMAAEAAAQQGKFWEMYDKIFANRRQLSPEKLRELAQEIGLDMTKYDADIQDTKLRQKLIDDLKQASEVGLTGTPTVFINGKYTAMRNKQAITAVVEKAIKESN